MQKALETELKILEIDKASLITKLERFGAVKAFDDLTEIWSFDINPGMEINLTKIPQKLLKTITTVSELTQANPNKSIRELGHHLRARKQGDHFEFTLKYSLDTKSQAKQQLELNTELEREEWEQIVRIMQKASFIVNAHQKKQRVSYIIEDSQNPAQFDIDTWPEIPTYLEIEAETEGIIFYWVKQFELEQQKTSKLVGQELFDLYSKEFYGDVLF